jgi:hypothetical protein
LMWGHYADGHRGYCLEFDTTKDPVFTKARQVRYDTALPRLGNELFMTASIEAAMKLLLTKGDCWEYEKEWRIFHRQAQHLYGFGSSLKSVYFGSKMSIELRQMIASLLEWKDAKLYEMHRSATHFKLVPNEVTFTRLDHRTSRES